VLVLCAVQAVRARDRVPPARSSGESEEEKDKPVLGRKEVVFNFLFVGPVA